jgi:UPF0716 protein FxsA
MELFTLIELGILTSAMTALLYVFATLVLGLFILQRQGKGMMERLMQGQNGSIVGPQLLLDDMAMGFAGLLLMFPGMISDFFALVVMIGPLRRRLSNAIFGPGPDNISREQDASGHQTIEGDFRRIDDE